MAAGKKVGRRGIYLTVRKFPAGGKLFLFTNPSGKTSLFDISETNLPGWMSMLEFLLRKQAKKARQKGIDTQLLEKYVKF